MLDCEFLRASIIGEFHDYKSQRRMPTLWKQECPG